MSNKTKQNRLASVLKTEDPDQQIRVIEQLRQPVLAVMLLVDMRTSRLDIQVAGAEKITTTLLCSILERAKSSLIKEETKAQLTQQKEVAHD